MEPGASMDISNEPYKEQEGSKDTRRVAIMTSVSFIIMLMVS